MRTLFRLLATTLALSAILLAGAPAALAGSDSGNGASTTRYTFSDEWCFDFGSTVDCSVSRGTLTVTETPDGRDIARIHFKLSVTTYDANGVQIGASRLTSFDRTVFADGGQDSSFSVEHGKATGPGYDCVFGYRLKIVGYELISERYLGPGCK